MIQAEKCHGCIAAIGFFLACSESVIPLTGADDGRWNKIIIIICSSWATKRETRKILAVAVGLLLIPNEPQLGL